MSVNTTYFELTPAICRICLSVDVRLHTIADTPLQLIYEKLTNISLHTADKRPVAACYICYALLHKSGKLLVTAAKAEKVLTDVSKKYSEITTESISQIDREVNGLSGSLTALSAEYFDNLPPVKVENWDEIKTEPGLGDVYNEMEFEDSTILQSQHDYACNNKENIHDNDYEDEMSANSFILESAGDLLVEKSMWKDGEVKKRKVQKKSSSRKRKHKSGDSGTLTDEQNTCANCQQTFRNVYCLQRHIKTNACKKYQCDKCQKQFKNSYVLKIHLRIHTDKTPYECKICPSKFNNLGNLRRHTKTMHENSIFECDVCKRKFNRKDYLKNHMKVHFSIKQYECSICKSQYTDHSNYNRHLKLHNNVKPHECNICESKFTLLHHLKSHLKIHSGEKPYKCKYCPRSFNHQSHLKTHNRTHTGEKPFECNICERRFNRRTHLRSHLKIHDKQDV